MSRRPRRNHSAVFKAKVAIAAIKGDRPIAQLAEQFDVHPNQITTWKAQLEGGAADVFGAGGGSAPGAGPLLVTVVVIWGAPAAGASDGPTARAVRLRSASMFSNDSRFEALRNRPVQIWSRTLFISSSKYL